MVETDKEKLQREKDQKDGNEKIDGEGVKAENGDVAEGGDANGTNGGVKLESAESKETKLAVVMKFQLGSSQYATMALRELTNGGAGAYKPGFSAVR